MLSSDWQITKKSTKTNSKQKYKTPHYPLPKLLGKCKILFSDFRLVTCA